MPESDPFSRVEYRRLIAWPERIRREWPLLERVLASAPSRRILDLGCGPGEHARFLVSQGFEVVGVDRSEAMLEKAREVPLPPGLQFVVGDLARLDELVTGPFGGAVCLGNTLPNLTSEESVLSFASALRGVLEAGAPVLVQILGYDRIIDQQVRALPVNVRPDSDEQEIVFLRLMSPQEDGSVRFFPTTLLLRPEGDPPVVVKRSQRVELRGWRRSELEGFFRGAGFVVEETLGGIDGKAFDPASSADLILVLRAG